MGGDVDVHLEGRGGARGERGVSERNNINTEAATTGVTVIEKSLCCPPVAVD